VAAVPGDHRRAGRSRLRASHADRDQVIGMLKAAFIQGRVTKDEFDERVTRTLAARTFGDLAGLTADLPAGLTDVPPRPLPPKPAPVTAAKIVLSCAAGLLAPAVLAAAAAANNEQLFALFILPTMITFMAWIVAGAVVVDSLYQKKHPNRPLPPGGGQRNQPLQTLQRGRDGRFGGELFCDARPDLRSPRPRLAPGPGPG
jgi:hypothetical protein